MATSQFFQNGRHRVQCYAILNKHGRVRRPPIKNNDWTCAIQEEYNVGIACNKSLAALGEDSDMNNYVSKCIGQHIDQCQSPNSSIKKHLITPSRSRHDLNIPKHKPRIDDYMKRTAYTTLKDTLNSKGSVCSWCSGLGPGPQVPVPSPCVSWSICKKVWFTGVRSNGCLAALRASTG